MNAENWNSISTGYPYDWNSLNYNFISFISLLECVLSNNSKYFLIKFSTIFIELEWIELNFPIISIGLELE